MIRSSITRKNYMLKPPIYWYCCPHNWRKSP
uniref:Uncharacterized protein n=1 Tax=Rhizophora mucronata TaxID=61149 RepID=A0A2P2JCH3_RHIMU